MDYSVYIRPLRLEDALTSYKWRNNPKLWRFTGNKPDRYITPEIETEWLANVLQRENEKRFAVCLKDNDTYIGNIFLTDIKDKEAQVHIFIGEMALWGGGRAYEAALQIEKYAFGDLGLDVVYADINKQNRASVALGKSLGLVELKEYSHPLLGIDIVRLVATKELFYKREYLEANKRKSSNSNTIA